MTANDIIPELTNGEFEKFTKEGTVLIDFFAEWCMPCVMMGPILEDLSEEFKEKVKIGKVNIEDNQDLASKFGVSSIPNFVLFKDGQVVEQIIGAMNQEDLGNVLRDHL
ncbi:MAG: thioredoxin [Nanoarchaeota archaeon]|nr:thioredoxin [Nanoarchaeota archaeon]